MVQAADQWYRAQCLVPVLLPLIQPLGQVTQRVGAMGYSSIQLHGGGKEGEHIGGWLD